MTNQERFYMFAKMIRYQSYLHPHSKFTIVFSPEIEMEYKYVIDKMGCGFHRNIEITLCGFPVKISMWLKTNHVGLIEETEYDLNVYSYDFYEIEKVTSADAKEYQLGVRSDKSA